MNTPTVIANASKHLLSLKGHILDLLTINSPVSLTAAVNLGKMVSKLSPLLGNLIEFNIVEFLNQQPEFATLGKWKRQDPGFPDAILQGPITPTPGFEIKAWSPFATEITARFKETQDHFTHDQTQVVLLAWIPDNIFYGKPFILDICIVSGKSVAKSRDDHYHNPPDYLVIEPNNTYARPSNLQQTNTSGYKWQGTPQEFILAEQLVKSWGPAAKTYSTDPVYQLKLTDIRSKFNYRQDTNFAKIDRIDHVDIEKFKERVLNSKSHNKTIKEWGNLLNGNDDNKIAVSLKTNFNIDWNKEIKIL